MRADTQTALNNVSLEPSADETAFSEAFERVARTYQNKLNALGRKLTKAIEKPTIEEFDAQPAIDKMKAQINNALKSFKFNIGGTVAGASISSKDAALVTREAIGSRVDSLLNQLDKNYAKIQKYKVFPEAMVQSNKDNADIINKLQAFKGELSAVNATTGDFVLPFEKAKEKLAELIAEVAKLDRELAQTGQRMPMLKTAEEIKKNINGTLKEAEKYKDIDGIKAVTDKLSNGKDGLLERVNKSIINIPTADLDKMNEELLIILQDLKAVNLEFSNFSKVSQNIQTRDVIANKADDLLKHLNDNYEKIRKQGVFSEEAQKNLQETQTRIRSVNMLKEGTFKKDKSGDYVHSLEEVQKAFENCVTWVDELDKKISTLGQKMPIQKAFDSAKTSVENMLKELDKYQQTDKIQAFRTLLEGDDGLLARINTHIERLPNKKYGIDDATNNAIALDNTIKQLQQDLAAVTKDAPLTKELEKAEVDAMRVQKSIVNLQERMQKSLVANSKGFSMPQYKKQFDAIYEATKSDALNGNDVNALTTKFKQLENSMREAGVTGKSFGDVMRGMYAKFGSWTMVTMTIQRVIMTFKRMVAAVQEVDSALTNLRKVTDATEADLERFMRGVGDSAHKLGATMSDLVNATAEFSRLGYDLNQSQKLGELATMYKSVAEDLDITTASQSIVSTLKAFEKAGISAERIVDVFNYVGNNFAISSAGIGEAMQRSAASLQTANNSLEQSVALITAA